MKKGKKLFLFGAICAISLCCALPTYAQFEPELREAAGNGNLEYVKKYIKEGAYVDSRNYDGETALYLAVKYSHYDVVNYLLEEAGANPNLGGKRDPLDFAAKNYKISICDTFLKHGGKIKYPESIAKYSLLDRDYAMASFLIDRNLVNGEKFKNICAEICMDDKNGFKEDEICDLFDVDFLNPNDSKLFTFAFSKNYKSVMSKMKELSKNEVKLDFNCDFIEKIIKKALRNCDKETLNLLIEEGGISPTALWERLGDTHDGSILYSKKATETIEFLLNKGVNVNHKFSDDETLLQSAIFAVNIDAVSFLLNHGADIYITKGDIFGKSYNNAFEYAKKYIDFLPSNSKSKGKEIYSMIKEFSKSHPDPNAKPKKSLFSKIFK